MTKIYSGIPNTDGAIPWIDDKTFEEGVETGGPRTLNLKYKRIKATSAKQELTDTDADALLKALDDK